MILRPQASCTQHTGLWGWVSWGVEEAVTLKVAGRDWPNPFLQVKGTTGWWGVGWGRMLSVQERRDIGHPALLRAMLAAQGHHHRHGEGSYLCHSLRFPYNGRERKWPLHAQCDWIGQFPPSGKGVWEVLVWLAKQNKSKQCDVTPFELQWYVFKHINDVGLWQKWQNWAKKLRF